MVGILLTGVLGYSASAFVAPSYTARGLVLMLPSKNAVGPGGNPFLGLGGLDLPARVVVAYYTSAPAQEAIAEVTPGASVTVSMEESTRGPVIAIDVSADSEASHRSVGEYAAERVDELLVVGDAAAAIHAGGGGTLVEDNAAAVEWLRAHLREGDAVLVKASRGARLDEVAAALA